MLSICIPTYNRQKYLEKNLNLLKNYIEKNKLENIVEIIISNNNSTDDTQIFLENYKISKSNIMITIYNQKIPLKMQENFIFVAEKSNNKYFMWLGDDDYIEEEYLLKVLGIIKENKNSNEIFCILPSNRPIDINGNLLKGGRDLNTKNIMYEKGFKNNCLINSYKAHQMSGIVFNKKLLKSYKERKVDNLYPFIYFSTLTSLIGKTYYITEYPVKVTAGEKKYWNYGKDGLISDFFNNYKKVYELSYIQRILLEIKFLNIQRWRYLQYKYRIPLVYLELLKSKNMTLVTKILLIIIMGFNIIISIIKKILKTIFRGKNEK